MQMQGKDNPWKIDKRPYIVYSDNPEYEIETSDIPDAGITTQKLAPGAVYAVGSYLIMSNVLYKVTAAIAAGETITPGTNVTATDVMTEVVALTA